MGETGLPGIYFWNKNSFGDQINRLIAEKMLANGGEFCEFDTCDLMALCSLPERFLSNSNISSADQKRQKKCLQDKPCHIWGSGLLYDTDPAEHKLVRPLIIHALRGEKTKAIMEKLVGAPINCVLADPGLLAPLLIPASSKKHKVGIIAHYRYENQPVFDEMLNHYPDAVKISIIQSPEEVFAEISSCEYIISTSLHGIIVADAYGVKNCWCTASDQVFGGEMKFHDYFSSFKTDRNVFDLNSGQFPDLEKDFALSYKEPYEVSIKQNELINCMPFEIKPEFLRDHYPLQEKLNDAIKDNKVADSVRIIRQASSAAPSISVITPVYNTDDYLGECIESILNNTFKDIELILVDDGSSDGSLKTAADFAHRYDNITLATQRNSTQAFARNLGLLLARGKYIYFADSDDLLEADALKIMYEKAEADCLDLLTFNASVIAEDGVEQKYIDHYIEYYQRTHPYVGIYTGPQLFTLLNQNDEYRCGPVLMFLNREFLLQNQLMYSMKYYHEDELFAFLVWLNAQRAEFIKDTLYIRRLRSGSVMLSEMTERNVLGYFYSHLRMIETMDRCDLPERQMTAFRSKAYEMLKLCKKRYRQMKSNRDFYLNLPEKDIYIFRTLIADDDEAQYKLNKKARTLTKENEKLVREKEKLVAENGKLSKKNAANEKKLKDIRSSLSFRIGRLLTWLPRKLKKLLKH